MIKKLLKFLGLLLLAFLLIGFIAYLIIDKPLPDGTIGLEAEQLTDEVLAAINKPAFDSLEYIEFTFRGEHKYEWDLANNTVNVAWADQKVFVNLNQSMEFYTLLELKAYEFFINDSFWLVAPYKIRDEGVTRSTVQVKNGRGLLVTYSSGGLTPGDSYLWIIDENGFPRAWRLWTSNVPIGGLEFSWDGWITLNEAWFSTLHQSSILDIPMEVSTVR